MTATHHVVNGYYLREPNAAEVLGFVRDTLGQNPWSKQVEVLESICRYRTTLVRSCTGAGKTKIAADAALAWLCTGPLRCVVTTAPTARQVKELLWKEIRKSIRSAELRGMPIGGSLPPSAPELRVEDDWLAIGFSSSDDVNFQGWHSPGGTLFILDEAMGVPGPVWQAIKGTLVSDWDRLLAIANPTSPEGEFFAMHKKQKDDNATGFKASLNKIQISAFDTPNVVEDRIVVPGLTTRAWIEERREEWGEDSPLWTARVLGEFPDSADNVLVPLSWLDAAVERWRAREQAQATGLDVTGGDDLDSPIVKVKAKALGPLLGPKAIGVDVARYGDDKSVMAVATFGTNACRIGRLGKTQGKGAPEVAGWIRHAREAIGGAEYLRIDGVGIGGGVIDILEFDKVPGVVDMQAGGAPLDKQRFFNARSEWAWNFREALRPDAPIPIELPPDDALTFQASSIRYHIRPSGQIALESKEDWRARTGKSSPDELDAVVFAIARGYSGGSKRKAKFHMA